MRSRIIPLLLLDHRKRLVKTVRFGERTYIGDPFNVLRIFNEKEVDEICVLDIDATAQDRRPDLGFVRELASECFMPLAYGGGIAGPADCESLNAAGVEKFVVGTAAAAPNVIRTLASTFGSQAVVGCVDVVGQDGSAKCVIRSATHPLGISPSEHARFLQDEGAGEILLQSVDRDGARSGLDLPLIERLAGQLSVPLIAAGGGGDVAHLTRAMQSGASAAASGSTFCFIGRLRAVLISYPSDSDFVARTSFDIGKSAAVIPAQPPRTGKAAAGAVRQASGRVCAVCVMDDSNPAIEFDEKGQCNCCRQALQSMPHEWWPGPDGQVRMQTLVDMLKESGKGHRYDAVVGLSGGIDSAYLAHVMRKVHGLRLLAIHVDGGWNSEPAVRNIESLVRKLDLDLHTYVVEWQEMRDLQLAFLKASVLNQDIPQDHAFFSTLYRTAGQFGIRHFLSGVNFATESIVPPRFGYPFIDGKHIRAIHARFGQRPLTSYPVMSMLEFLWMVRVRKQLTVHRPLDFLNYNKEQAKQELATHYGWCDYGGKHHESRFTKFYQEIYLPQKFGFDKRRLHLSSLIVSGQLTRAEAMVQLAQPIMDESQRRRDMKFIAKKLGITPAALTDLIDQLPVPHQQYPNHFGIYTRLTRARIRWRHWKDRWLRGR